MTQAGDALRTSSRNEAPSPKPCAAYPSIFKRRTSISRTDESSSTTKTGTSDTKGKSFPSAASSRAKGELPQPIRVEYDSCGVRNHLSRLGRARQLKKFDLDGESSSGHQKQASRASRAGHTILHNWRDRRRRHQMPTADPGIRSPDVSRWTRLAISISRRQARSTNDIKRPISRSLGSGISMLLRLTSADFGPSVFGEAGPGSPDPCC